jgi:hypothetical protein
MLQRAQIHTHNTLSLSITHTHTLTLSLSHTHTHSLSLSLTHTYLSVEHEHRFNPVLHHANGPVEHALQVGCHLTIGIGQTECVCVCLSVCVCERERERKDKRISHSNNTISNAQHRKLTCPLRLPASPPLGTGTRKSTHQWPPSG